MILVTVIFILGGSAERYVCQTTKHPYELLQVNNQRLGRIAEYVYDIEFCQ